MVKQQDKENAEKGIVKKKKKSCFGKWIINDPYL